MAEVSAGSVSKVNCTLTLSGVGEAKVSLYRHMAPLTVNAVLRSLPIHSRVSIQPGMVTLFTDIKVGVEKAKTQFNKGEVAFLPSGGLVCIFLKPAKSDRPLNPIGSVESPPDELEGARLGAVAKLALAPEQAPPTDLG